MITKDFSEPSLSQIHPDIPGYSSFENAWPSKQGQFDGQLVSQTVVQSDIDI